MLIKWGCVGVLCYRVGYIHVWGVGNVILPGIYRFSESETSFSYFGCSVFPSVCCGIIPVSTFLVGL